MSDMVEVAAMDGRHVLEGCLEADDFYQTVRDNKRVIVPFKFYAKEWDGDPRIAMRSYMCSRTTSVARVVALTMTRLVPANNKPQFVQATLEKTIGNANSRLFAQCLWNKKDHMERVLP